MRGDRGGGLAGVHGEAAIPGQGEGCESPSGVCPVSTLFFPSSLSSCPPRHYPAHPPSPPRAQSQSQSQTNTWSETSTANQDEEDGYLLQQALAAARAVHHAQGVEYNESQVINVLTDVKFVVVTVSLPLGREY